MKTEQILVRRLGEYNVPQRISDKMFNANALLQQWDKANTTRRRKMDEYLQSPKTKEFMEAIIEDENESRKSDLPNNQILIKGRVKTLKNGKRIPADIWMHPLLFLDFAMWLNPKFKLQVLKFIADHLIEFRHLAGDHHRPMCEAVANISQPTEVVTNIKRVTRALNIIVYNEHQRGIRNLVADEVKLKELSEIQKEVSTWVNLGMIENFEQLKKVLQRKYRLKYTPSII